ncbi:MAG: hypothetical protein QOJ83_2552, partial [Frankiales bacterium]|nr:hypothetical protein [Frankiales bacterium]
SQPAAPTSGRATFGIKPSHETLKAPIDARARFDYTATPGAQQPDYVAISNNALTPLTLNVYASDGLNTESGGFDLLPASGKPVDVGSWITLKAATVTLKPGASVVVPFTVKVPAKVAPGDHVGGIVASLRTYGLDKKGNRVAIDTRVGTRVYLRIQGPLDPRLTIGNLHAKYSGSWWNPFVSGKVTVSYTVANRGNVRLGAHGSLDLGGWFGSAHSASVPEIAELLPDNTHQEQVVVDHVVRAFHERATVTAIPFSMPGDTDGRLTSVTATVHFWAVPWALLVVILLVPLTAVALLVRGWRRRRKSSAPPVAGPSRQNSEVKP